MATVTKTVKKTGGDYSVIQTAEAAADLNSGADIWKIVVSDNEEYDEDLVFDQNGTGTGSYVWLTSDPANRHAGVAGTGHARILGNGDHVIEISGDWTRVSWMEIQSDSTSNSDEGVRLADGVTNVLVQYCIIWTDQAVISQDGVYAGSSAPETDASFDHLIVYGFDRAGFHLQNVSGTSTNNTWAIDHCAVYKCGDTDSVTESGGYVINQEDAGGVAVWTIYNSWGSGCINDSAAADEPYHDQPGTGRGTPAGTVTWNGTHNLSDFNTRDDIDGTDNTTNWQDATSGEVDTTKTSGAWLVVNSLTAGSEDLTLLDAAAGNLAAGNGTNRQGSEPDARQDFSVDITGGARPTSGVDIGPHQVSVAAAAAVYPPFPRRQNTLVRM